MKRKLLFLSMILFFMGATGGIYFLPTQEALFVARANSEQVLQELGREFTNSFKKPQLRTNPAAVGDLITMLAQFLGIAVVSVAVVQSIFLGNIRFLSAFDYYTPGKAKKLKRFWDDIL